MRRRHWSRERERDETVDVRLDLFIFGGTREDGRPRVEAEKLMAVDDVLEAAKRAKEAGSTRFCMGTAWRRGE